MGLDVTCKCRKINFRAGSYSGFGHWRRILAKLVNIDLDEMEGFDGTIQWTGDERFYELFNHSDCDGTLTPNQCKELLKDFEESNLNLLELMNLISNSNSELEYWVLKLGKWREAIQHSINECCTIIFC